jgi:hypothetical protein
MYLHRLRNEEAGGEVDVDGLAQSFSCVSALSSATSRALVDQDVDFAKRLDPASITFAGYGVADVAGHAIAFSPRPFAICSTSGLSPPI